MEVSWMKILFALLFVLLASAPRCSAVVEVSTPVDTYWGNYGDEELQIVANVTSDNQWGGVSVFITTPDGLTSRATTDNNDDSATSKLYSYTITSLYERDQGVYRFTAEDSTEASAEAEDATVMVYVYTLDVRPSTKNYYTNDLVEEMTISVEVRTDGDWNAVEVVVESPDGETLETTFENTDVGFWRTYKAMIQGVVQGSYIFVATETLGEAPKTLSSEAIVEVSESTNVDEYLYRIDLKSADLTSKIPDFYSYTYDGPDRTYIMDGGKDMYDNGNYISVTTTKTESPNISYGKSYTFDDFTLSSMPTYPFTTLLWISNSRRQEDSFSIEVMGHTGAAGVINSATHKSNFDSSTYSVDYDAYQVFGDDQDPSICEVYFTITNSEVWSSSAPSSIDFQNSGVLPNGLDNIYTVNGTPRNIMMGYMLLSSETGAQIAQNDIEEVLKDVTTYIESKDGFSVESDSENVIERDETSATLKTRITTPGDWNDLTIQIRTPAAATYTLTAFTEDGDARIYEYTINDLSEEDSGVYTFIATDSYGFTEESTTELSVHLADISASDTEYWGNNGDAELIISVLVEANDWSNTNVVVISPMGTIYDAVTESTELGEREYTHRITNLFEADAGEYVFRTQTNGVASSAEVVITVYLYTLSITPDNFNSHAVGTKDTVTFMVYAVCDGDWTNVMGSVKAPSGDEFAMDSSPGQLPTIRIFYASITGIENGEHNISVTETLGKGAQTITAHHTVEIHNSTQVDEYLYRIGLQSEELVSYVDGWKTYWYDGEDHSFISDGGFDLYDTGNKISIAWSSGAEENIPYGKPFENELLTYSSKDFYPFISMLWIGNENQEEEEFSLTVTGRTGIPPSATWETYRRILVEGTYDVTYRVFQAYDVLKPSICEVYFLVTNTYEWNSTLPDDFELTIGGNPPQILENTAKVTGSPSNVMLGYTLLSKDDGNKVDYLEIEKVIEKYIEVVAERDQFFITPSTEDGVYTSYQGENGTVEATVHTSGNFDGISVEVELPNGQRKDVTNYKLSNLHTERIFQYTIPECDYDKDGGDYKFIVTDKYGEIAETTSQLHVFTIESYAETTQYVGGEGDTVFLECYVTTRNYLMLAEIDTPTEGTVEVTDWTDDSTPVRTYRYRIENPTYEADNGNYTFRITETIYEEYQYPTEVGVDLAVFSTSATVPTQSYTADESDEILEITVDVTTFAEWGAIVVQVFTPGRGIQTVTESDVVSDTKRTYIYQMREISTKDAGEYLFQVTETLIGETRTTETERIEVIVKESKLSGGAIAGIVIGSVVGAVLIVVIIYQLMCKGKKDTTSRSTSDSESGGVENTAMEDQENPKAKKKAEAEAKPVKPEAKAKSGAEAKPDTTIEPESSGDPEAVEEPEPGEEPASTAL